MKYEIDEEKIHGIFTNWQHKFGGLTQETKAEKIGISKSVVNRLETKKKRFGQLKAHHFIKVAQCLEVHPAELLKRAE